MRKSKKVRAYGRSCRLIRDDDWDDLCSLNQQFSKVSLGSPARATKQLLDNSSGYKFPIPQSPLSSKSPAKPPLNSKDSVKEATPLLKHSRCVNSPILNYLSPLRQKKGEELTAEDKVLKMCGQTAPVPFEEYFDGHVKKTIKKLGEGCYSEVFCFEDSCEKSVVKIIPVEDKGKMMFNGGKLKTFEEILPEMAIAQELSNLGSADQENLQQLHYFAPSFLHVNRFAVVVGCVPDHLVKEWERWDQLHKSENDHPRVFGPDQLFVLFESPHGGTDLEHFEFCDSAELVSVYQQTVAALAIAEKCLQFEHRDLHWGNVLVTHCPDCNVEFILDGTMYKIKSNGIKVTIIDFTLSRLRRDECILYFNLEAISWLFEGQGDFQFEVYRMMRQETKKDWEGFYSCNNVFWIMYLLEKLLKGVKGNIPKDKNMSSLRRHRTLLKRNNYPSVLKVFETLAV